MTNDRLTKWGREDRRSHRHIPTGLRLKTGAASRAALGVAIVVFALMVSPARAGERTWTTNGPNGGAVLSLAADTSDPAILYAGTESGIFKSTDGGSSWSLASASVLSPRCLAADPSDRFTLYAGSDAGLFKSTDSGGHFSLVTEVATPIAAIAFDQSNPPTVYAGGRGSQVSYDYGSANVYTSSDAGQHWSVKNTLLVDSIASLLAPSFDSLVSPVIAGTDVSQSYYPGVGAVIGSVNGGDSWTRLVNREPHSISAVKALVGVGDAIYAGTNYGYPWDEEYWGLPPRSRNGAVLRSLDRGATWRRFPLGLRATVSSLAIDPGESTTLYAGTDRGVFWSTDSGENWTPLREGLADLHVTSLAIDPQGSSLHAGTPAGVFDRDLPVALPAFQCDPDDRHLCLLGGRFRVGIVAHDATRDRTTSAHAVPQGDRFGYFSFPDFTGDPSFPEVVVKMIDASTWKQPFWFFHSGMTNVDYVVTVIDTVTGRIRTYGNVLSSPYCGGADTEAFPADVSTPAGSIEMASRITTPETSQTSLSLLSGRFTVSLSATKPSTGRVSEGVAIPQDDRFGYFSLPDFTGDSSFPEVFVKMVDATSLTGSFWVFYTGLTSLPYTLTFTDTVTGQTRTYESGGGISLCGDADTETFAAESRMAMSPARSGFLDPMLRTLNP
jgi:photosystem II stability/assembly factor-like uncharacterized protein